MLISQKKAVAQIKAETGLSLVCCVQIIKRLPKVRDGLRDKIHIHHLNQAITKANRPTEIREENRIRFSQKTIERIRTECI